MTLQSEDLCSNEVNTLRHTNSLLLQQLINRSEMPHLVAFNISNQSEQDISQNHLNFSEVYQGFTIDPIARVIYATVKDFSKSDIKMLTAL